MKMKLIISILLILTLIITAICTVTSFWSFFLGLILGGFASIVGTLMVMFVWFLVCLGNGVR